MLYGKLTYSGGYYYFGGVTTHSLVAGNDTYNLSYNANDNIGEINFKVAFHSNANGIGIREAHKLLHEHIDQHIKEIAERHRRSVCIAFPESIVPPGFDLPVPPYVQRPF